jgi:hypothetical protein
MLFVLFSYCFLFPWCCSYLLVFCIFFCNGASIFMHFTGFCICPYVFRICFVFVVSCCPYLFHQFLVMFSYVFVLFPYLFRICLYVSVFVRYFTLFPYFRFICVPYFSAFLICLCFPLRREIRLARLTQHSKQHVQHVQIYNMSCYVSYIVHRVSNRKLRVDSIWPKVVHQLFYVRRWH